MGGGEQKSDINENISAGCSSTLHFFSTLAMFISFSLSLAPPPPLQSFKPFISLIFIICLLWLGEGEPRESRTLTKHNRYQRQSSGLIHNRRLNRTEERLGRDGKFPSSGEEGRTKTRAIAFITTLTVTCTGSHATFTTPSVQPLSLIGNDNDSL